MQAPERILVKEVNWLGDVVMSLPALRAVRGAFPRARLSVLVKKELAGFFEGSEWIDEIIPYQFRKGVFNRFSDRRKIIAALKERRFDLAILFPNSFESALWPLLARIPRRAGYSRDARGLLLNLKTSPTAQILSRHQVHYYLALLRETLGVEGSPEDFKPDVGARSLETMRAFLNQARRRPNRPLIALAVAAAYGPAKEWPAKHFARLIDLLAEKHGAECVLVGAPNERHKAEAVLALARTSGILAAGKTSVGEALALLSLCSGFAGNDSGSMHVAGALGLPTVGIFGSSRPDRTAPLGPRTKTLQRLIPCSPCLKRTCRYGHYECLKQIQPEEVLAALEALIADPGARASARLSLSKSCPPPMAGGTPATQC